MTDTPEHQMDAYRLALKNKESRMAVALRLIEERGGLSASQLMEITRWSYPTASSTMTYLKQGGLIRGSGEKHVTQYGGRAEILIPGVDAEAVERGKRKREAGKGFARMQALIKELEEQVRLLETGLAGCESECPACGETLEFGGFDADAN